MKTLTILSILTTLTACGAEPSIPTDAAKTDKAPETAAQVPVKEVPQAEVSDDAQATLVADVASRPSCKAKSQLIYVMESKQFQVCDGAGTWADAEVSQTVVQNTTEQVTKVEQITQQVTQQTTQQVTNVNSEANVMTDSSGHDWILYRNVQKSNIPRGKICPTGYAVATRAQIEAVIATPDLFNGFLDNNFFPVWTDDLQLVSLYISNGTQNIGSVWYNAAQIANIKATQAHAFCTK